MDASMHETASYTEKNTNESLEKSVMSRIDRFTDGETVGKTDAKYLINILMAQM